MVNFGKQHHLFILIQHIREHTTYDVKKNEEHNTYTATLRNIKGSQEKR